MQKTESLTTQSLGVSGVDVVGEKPSGTAFAGPFYPDDLDQLREMLRRMPKREAHVVYDAGKSIWIHRK